jgi:hypothetical protein
MKSVKLFAFPFLIIIRRKAHHRHLLECPLIIINSLNTPRAVHDRIAKRSSMRSANPHSIEQLFVVVVVTACTGRESRRSRFEVHSFMLCMTINTTHTCSFMRFDHRSHKSIGVVTLSAPLFH